MYFFLILINQTNRIQTGQLCLKELILMNEMARFLMQHFESTLVFVFEIGELKITLRQLDFGQLQIMLELSDLELLTLLDFRIARLGERRELGL